jgi:hypothetical protein
VEWLKVKALSLTLVPQKKKKKKRILISASTSKEPELRHRDMPNPSEAASSLWKLLWGGYKHADCYTVEQQWWPQKMRCSLGSGVVH